MHPTRRADFLSRPVTGVACLVVLAIAIGLSASATGDATTGAATTQAATNPVDLSRWKLTLPVDTDLKERPDEVLPRQLQSFEMPDVFYRGTRNSIVLKARCDGVTTKGSSYPRCELREMNETGSDEASWSTDDSVTHELLIRLAIQHLPVIKPHVVCAQIHDSHADVLMIRLEKKKLFVERENLPDVLLDADYSLGTFFDLRIAAADGQIRVWHNDQLRLTFPARRSGCYFKAGCYTQSNLKRGDRADAFGQVEIQRLELR